MIRKWERFGANALPVCGLCACLGWQGTAWGAPFLSLPLGEGHPITCRWTCLNPDGSTYNHQATDYGRTNNTTNILAAADGVVELVVDGILANTHPRGAAYGNQVRIRHLNRYLTIYAHLLPNTITVRVGDRVDAGQLLGRSDNTGRSSGPHLHFEVRDPSGRRVNPYGDPPDYTGGCGPNALWVTCPPQPAPPPDRDRDGYTTAMGDCDDGDRMRHPGATEICNGIDEDCNGTADDPWRTGSAALDRPCAIMWDVCRGRTNGHWRCTSDHHAVVCDAPVPPTPPELCNGRDDDCDGTVDVIPPMEVTRVLTAGGVDLQYLTAAWNERNRELLVAWLETSCPPPTICHPFRLFVLRLDRFGTPLGSVQLIEEYPATGVHGLDLAWDGTTYGIVTEIGDQIGALEVWFQRLGGDGIPLDPATRVGPFPTTSLVTVPHRSRVRIAALLGGFVMVGRRNERRTDDGDLVWWWLDRDGIVQRGPVSLRPMDPMWSVSSSAFDVSMVDDRIAVIWEETAARGDHRRSVVGVWSRDGNLQRIVFGEVATGAYVHAIGLALACTSTTTCVAFEEDETAIIGSSGYRATLTDIDLEAALPQELWSAAVARAVPVDIVCRGTTCALLRGGSIIARLPPPGVAPRWMPLPGVAPVPNRSFAFRWTDARAMVFWSNDGALTRTAFCP